MIKRYILKLSLLFGVLGWLLWTLPLQLSAQSSTPYPPPGRFFTAYLPVADRLIVNSEQQLIIYGNQTIAFSEDGGQTWSYGDEPAYYAPIGDIGVAPDFAKSKIIWAGLQYTTDALRVSEDAGDSWKGTIVSIPGPIVDIAVSQQYATDHTFYAAINAGAETGVLRTIDKGQTWQNMTPGIGQFLRTIELSPVFPQDQTLLLLFGDKGVLRSRNGGLTWEQINVNTKGTNYNYLYHLHFSSGYQQDRTLFAATSAGLMKSTDDGKSWALITKTKKSILKTATVIKPGIPLTIFAIELTSPSDSFANLLRSQDGGNTWQTVLATTDVLDIGVPPNYTESGVLYVLGKGALYASRDQGSNWNAVTSRFPWRNQSWSKFVLSPNFSKDGVAFVYSGNNLLLRSTDAANSWTQIPLPEAPLDQSHRISLAPLPNWVNERNIFLYINRSLYVSANLGGTWSLISNNLPVATTGQMSPDRLHLSPQFSTDQTIFLVNYEKGSYRSLDGGRSWDLLESLNNAVDPFDGPLVAITGFALSPNYIEDKTMFATIYNEGVYRSNDGGNSWKRLDISSVKYSPDYLLRVSPTYQSDKTLFIAGSGSSGGGLGRSVDGGDNWVDLSSEQLLFYIKDLALSPQFAVDQTLMISTEFNEPLFSEDSGATWFRLKGIREDGSRAEIGTGFTIASFDGRIVPLVSQATTIMKYRWPKISIVTAPSLVCFTADSQDRMPSPQSVIVSTLESTTNNWYISSSNLQGASAEPLRGTTPGAFTISPTVTMGSEITGQLTVKVELSYKQAVSQSVVISNNCQHFYLSTATR